MLLNCARVGLWPTQTFLPQAPSFFLDQAETLQRQHHRTFMQLRAWWGSALWPGLLGAMGKLL